ncbi:hypothetical protein [Brevibacillus porteri]|uniref:hypothetical protein n=1 Tax=Brevibacillus porteri TaxID=2126350 RepID=UPI00037116DE|nr:hypothetical protein A616_17045 [Brevibacillus brevis X23]
MADLILRLNHHEHDVFDSDTTVDAVIHVDSVVAQNTISFHYQNKGQEQQYSFTLTKEGMEKLIRFYNENFE